MSRLVSSACRARGGAVESVEDDKHVQASRGSARGVQDVLESGPTTVILSEARTRAQSKDLADTLENATSAER